LKLYDDQCKKLEIKDNPVGNLSKNRSLLDCFSKNYRQKLDTVIISGGIVRYGLPEGELSLKMIF
jgi:hypothetical protein